MSNGSAGLDILLQRYAFRGDLEYPGKDERYREADSQDGEDGGSDPVREVAEGDQHFGHLHDEPGGNDIERRHAEDVSPLELR